MHPYACIYHGIGIRSWAALSVAGDAASTWRAVHDRECRLSLDPEWGWTGPCTGDQDALGLHVAREAAARLPRDGLVAVGMGTSKGSISALLAGRPPLRSAPGALSLQVAADLDLRTHLPCATAAACSTGLACLLAGADAVERGLAACALVGAAESSLHPLVLAGFRNAGVLCGRTPPQAFAQATGFAPAAGAAAFVLGTPHDGDWRLVAGVRLGDAGHETQFTDPRTLATALQALWDLLPAPDLIACHATGTAAGDRYEMAGLDAGPWRDMPRWCAKPWIGHALGASSAVELAACLESGSRRLWKLSLGFGGHLVAVALERRPS
jgi:hypothetical protein